jgi:hypothetical protein
LFSPRALREVCGEKIHERPFPATAWEKDQGLSRLSFRLLKNEFTTTCLNDIRSVDYVEKCCQPRGDSLSWFLGVRFSKPGRR